MKNLIYNTQRHKGALEQVEIMLANQKEIYFFGGLGSMSLASVNAQFLKTKGIDFNGFIANERFIQQATHLGKPVVAIEKCEIPRDVNVIVGISNWIDARSELESYGFHNIFVFDAFAELFLEDITLEYFQKNIDGFEQTYAILQDQTSKDCMVAYLQGKIFNNFSGLASTYAGGGHILKAC
ncbi:hypothetical protein BBW65_06110 [Helicobacter enhydrae]|uniref:Uncharacterized protein n=1 Tax=Helicobacter enhydrae TaxID=222136 RepID=A0A1B1U6H1_9HELI|nr:hypothetical protein [Helicobacter enhydrae]ANV98394.1 hypothetical protein BBW65_06110 [Helicobacter enhydrae]